MVASTPGTRIRLRLLPLAFVAALHGCVGERGGPRVGAPAPEYVAATLAGDSVSLASLRGNVVLLNLWATWCAPCRHEVPFLQSLHERHGKDGLAVVGVSLDARGARQAVEEFAREYGVTYRILVDPEMRAMDTYRVLGLPASFLIDRSGTLRWMRFGPLAADDVEFTQALEAMLQ